MMDGYDALVGRISSSSGLAVEEIDRKVEAKRAKLSGLVSKEGAAQIVAAELGINFDKERMNISELVQGMKRANVLGKVIQVLPIREYNKNGRSGKIGRFVLADESSNTNVVLWDTNHIGLIEKGDITEGQVVEVSNANIRNGELHLSSFSDIKKSNEKIGDVVEGKVFAEKKILEVSDGDNLSLRAFVLQVFDPRYFEVNVETGKKVTEEDRANGVKIQKRALLNLVLDDGSESIRTVLFGEQINKLGLTEEEVFSLEKFGEKKEGLLGEEMIFIGKVRNNSFSGNLEMTVEDVQRVNTEELVKVLEAKA
jgi:hypothetical protein